MSATRHEHDRRWQALQSERTSWVPHWQDLSRHLQPRLGKFFTADRNKGEKRHNNIYDSTATRAVRVLAAGMMAGMTSPARPWFRLTTGDPDLAESHEAREWLNDVRRLMLDVFARSNTYPMLQNMYEEIGVFGTGASILMPDFDNIIHHYPSTIGEFAISTNHKGMVDTFYREFDKTVDQLVAEFGRENCSSSVKNMYDRGHLDKWITVVHGIEKRHQRDPMKRDALNMPFATCYFEKGAEPGKYLRKGGMKDFRVLAPRWHASGGDIYGYSPGMEALGDVKQLQHEQLRKAQSIDYQTKPPLMLPASMKGRTDMLPGGTSFYDGVPPTGVRSMFEANLNLNYLLEDIRDVRDRINSTFYVDLFLMLAQTDNGQMTATEVAERHEEKLLMLGPVLERLHNELLDPLIALTFADLLEAGVLPPLPEVLEGSPIRVEFVSMLAQAQRAVGTASTDRFIGNLGAVMTMKPEVADKFDADKWVDHYSDALGIDPDLIVPDDKVVLIREERAAAQKQAEQAAMAEQMAGAAKDAAAAPTQGGDSNALDDIMGLYSGYNSPSPQEY